MNLLHSPDLNITEAVWDHLGISFKKILKEITRKLV